MKRGGGVLMRKKSKTAETLRQAIRDSGISINALAKKLGLHTPQLWEFASGRRDLSMVNADRLMDFFGLEVRPRGVTARSAR
jgi:plasmid maintenance system antidote protein VapI